MTKNFSYVSVAESLYNDFIMNKLDIGDVLPTEQDLIEYYKVSRTTVRRCIQKLAKDNLVYTIQGSGTFVKGKKKESRIFGFLGYCGYAKQLGSVPSSKILGFDIEPVSKEVAEILQLKEGTPVYKTKRLRYLDDIPKQVEVGFLPVALFPDFSMDVLLGSKYRYIEETKKMTIKSNHLILEPIFLDADTAKLLKMQANAISLCIKSTGFLEDGTIFEYTEMIENTNKYNLSFNIIRGFS